MMRRAVTAGAMSWVLLVAVAGVAGAQDPQGVIGHSLALDNDTVRVVLLTFPPASASGRHMGLEPELGMVVEGELTLVTDNGRQVLGPGTAHWLPGLTPHDARNEGDRPVKLWVVLFKRCD